METNKIYKENVEAANKLRAGFTITIMGIGNSMTPLLKSGQSVICEPVKDDTKLNKRDIVLCKVKGHYYLHLIWAVKSDNTYLIGNNHGKPNGTISRSNIFGKVIEKL